MAHSSRAASRALLWVLLVVAPFLGAQQPATSDSAPPALRIRQLDVGQGDAALVTTPEGRRILIDAGPNPSTVANLLKSEGIDTLDLVIASHGHTDHIGGLPLVFAAVVVRAYVDNGVPQNTSIYRRVLRAVEREPGLRYLRATERTITIGSVKIAILPPAHVDASQNNNSVGIVVEYGQFRALYTGDSEQAELAEWLRQRRIPRVSFVKVAHHGSWNGTTLQLVRATVPNVAIISVGANNGYGHPSAKTVRQWAAAARQLYRTDRDGEVDVTVTPDGHMLVRTARDSVAQRP